MKAHANQLFYINASFAAVVAAIASQFLLDGAAHAQEVNSCPVDYVPEIQVIEGRNVIEAGLVELVDDIYYLSGVVRLQTGSRQIRADRMVIDFDSETVEAVGNVTIIESGRFELNGSRTSIDLKNDVSVAHDVSIRVSSLDHDGEPTQVLLRATADKAEIGENGIIELYEVAATNCFEEASGVAVHSDRIVLDLNEKSGTAKRASIVIGGTGVVTLPKIWFPIGDERRSGFLFPSAGYAKRHGALLEVPYYFNLAENYDATQIVKVMTKRGVQMDYEFRHLGVNSTTYARLAAMPNDSAYKRKNLGNDDRSAFLLDYKWHDEGPIYFGLNSRFVSDKSYLKDFGGTFGGTGDDYLRQDARIDYVGDSYRLALGTVRYLPASVGASHEKAPFGSAPWASYDQAFDLTPSLRLSASVKANEFRRHGARHGSRVNAAVALEQRYLWSFGESSVRVGSEYIKFSSLRKPLAKDENSVASPFVALEGRMFFDQEPADAGDSWWSIEPRVKYLHRKRRAQDHLPEFDTSIAKLDSYEDLFRDDRYVGGDRNGDADRITLGLSADLNSAGGARAGGFGIGQIFYLSDRAAMLEGETAATHSRSDLFVSTYWRFAPAWEIGMSAMLDHEDRRTINQNSISVSGETPNYRVYTVYRYLNDRDNLYLANKQKERVIGNRLDIHLDSPWTVGISHLYSLEDDKTIESSLLFEYVACCWSASIDFGHETDSSGEGRDHIMLRFSVIGNGQR